jgi:hypothetical protein
VCYQDQRSLETGPAQTAKAFIHQTPAKSAGLVSRLNGQMINISAASVVTAQCDANNRRAIDRHSAQPRVAREKVRNAFPVITFGNLETLNPLPQLKRRVVIANGKFSRFDVVAHLRSGHVVAANTWTMNRLSRRLPANITSFAIGASSLLIFRINVLPEQAEAPTTWQYSIAIS